MTWNTIREAGAVIEEAVEDDDEKVLEEKAAIHIAAQSNLAHAIELEGRQETPQEPVITDVDVGGIR